jgi:hypothetical protein
VTDEIEITETAVGSLAGQRVGVGNLMESDYTDARGAERQGMTAQLFLLGRSERVIVGAGSVVNAGGLDWEVLSVDKRQGEHGSVTLRPVAAP